MRTFFMCAVLVVAMGVFVASNIGTELSSSFCGGVSTPDDLALAPPASQQHTDTNAEEPLQDEPDSSEEFNADRHEFQEGALPHTPQSANKTAQRTANRRSRDASPKHTQRENDKP